MKKFLIIVCFIFIPSVSFAIGIVGGASDGGYFSSLCSVYMDEYDRFPRLRAYNLDSGLFMSSNNQGNGCLDTSGFVNGDNVVVLHVEGIDWVRSESGQSYRAVYRNSDACLGISVYDECREAIEDSQNIHWFGGYKPYWRSPVFNGFYKENSADLVASVSMLPSPIELGLFYVLGWAFGFLLVVLFIFKLVYRIK